MVVHQYCRPAPQQLLMLFGDDDGYYADFVYMKIIGDEETTAVLMVCRHKARF